jgi:hypothetical protein
LIFPLRWGPLKREFLLYGEGKERSFLKQTYHEQTRINFEYEAYFLPFKNK